MSLSLQELQSLHDRSTRGEILPIEEETQLEKWYQELNRQESEVLFGQPVPPLVERGMNSLLQKQISNLLEELASTTGKLQKVSAENEQLRIEVALLRAEVSQQVVSVAG